MGSDGAEEGDEVKGEVGECWEVEKAKGLVRDDMVSSAVNCKPVM